jgi:hypothetical protein
LKVRRFANPFRVRTVFFCDGAQGSRKLEPWAEISERLRRNGQISIGRVGQFNRRDQSKQIQGFASKLDHARFVGWSLATKRHKKLKKSAELFEIFVPFCDIKAF